MAILGLLDTETFANERFKNVRRSVFYFYPNGAAPLVGILSLLKEENTNDPRFLWYEKRLSDQRTSTVANTTGPFITNTGTNADAANPFVPAANSTLRIVVADSTLFRVGHQIKVRQAVLSGGGATDIFGVVTATSQASGVSGTANTIDVRLMEAYGSFSNIATSVGLEVWVVGSSFAQGLGDISSSIYNLPVDLENFTQIYRSPFSFTGTALKTALKFDETGPYKDKAKETSVMHMLEIEKSFLFGRKVLYSGGATPQYSTGGILYWLQQWEAGTTYGNTAATLDTDDNKRIIANASGVINEKTYDTYLERLFRVTNNKSNEKLVLCGSGFLSVINQMYRSKTCLNSDLPLDSTYGMNVVKHQTPFGTIYYKTHPLFSQNPTLRFNALFLDVQNLVYRAMQGRDTELLKNRQNNDEDLRKDEWLTEAGLELRFPESHMYLQNVTSYVP